MWQWYLTQARLQAADRMREADSARLVREARRHQRRDPDGNSSPLLRVRFGHRA
jgi:hypothetical protein